MVEAELRQRVALAEEQLAELKTALGDMRAQRDAWQAMAQARIRPAQSGKARGHGFGQPDDKVSPEVPSEGTDVMQLELSNFQPLAAANERGSARPRWRGAAFGADDRRK